MTLPSPDVTLEKDEVDSAGRSRPGPGRKQMGFSDSETVRQHGSSLLVNFSALTESSQD